MNVLKLGLGWNCRNLLLAEHRGQQVGALLGRGQWRQVVSAKDEALLKEPRYTLCDDHTKAFIKVTEEHSDY